MPSRLLAPTCHLPLLRSLPAPCWRRIHTSPSHRDNRDNGGYRRSSSPRGPVVGEEIHDDYARLRERYETPRHPIVLAHGLLGFAELRPAGRFLPPITYWRGIHDALLANARLNLSHSLSSSHPSSPSGPESGLGSGLGSESGSGPHVIACTVPPCASIAERAAHLAADIFRQLSPSPSFSSSPITVNIIAHSMGGLDARYLISRLRPPWLRISSLTTIATPHRGSCIADLLLEPPPSLHPPPQDFSQQQQQQDFFFSHQRFSHPPRIRALLARVLRSTNLSADAFVQLSRPYLIREFNPHVPDDPLTRYFSYGASISPSPLSPPSSTPQTSQTNTNPSPSSPFRLAWSQLRRREGPNDGLVSVESARWGEYRGTLMGVSHLDLINWTNWNWVGGWLGVERSFNAVALYLDIADMLAKEGL